MNANELRLHLTEIQRDLLLLIEKIAEEESHETRRLLESLYIRISILTSQFNEMSNRICGELNRETSLEKPGINCDKSL